jgi:hypothetical protein
MKTKKVVFVMVLCTLTWSNLLNAQTQIISSVFGSGATATASNANRIVGTLGQALTGVTGSASNTAQSGFWAQTVDLITSVEQIPAESIPKEFRLEQNYPNPFNPTTTIQFALPKRSSVTLKLYDILGREVAILVDEELPPGEYKVQFDAAGLASGVYFYRLETEGFVRTRKLMLLR